MIYGGFSHIILKERTKGGEGEGVGCGRGILFFPTGL